MIEIEFNQQVLSVEQGCSLQTLLVQQAITPQGIAVVVNGQIVPKAHWPEQMLSAQAQVNVFKAIAGG